jgi:cell division control protein 6
MKSPFTQNNSLFKTKKPFDDAFVPPDICGRDQELQKYINALQDIVDGFAPPNILVYGETGLGKTATTKHVLNLLRDELSETNRTLTVLEVNCNKHDSTYSTLRHLADRLNEKSYTQGHSRSGLWDVVYDGLDALGDTILLVLDGLEHLDPDTDLLYELSRASTELENAHLGIIGIATDSRYPDQLSLRIRRNLNATKIHFNLYDASDLRAILDYHCDLAFKNGVVNDDVVPLAAALTAQATGDARTGLTLLETAGDLAQTKGADTVTRSHVEHARTEAESRTVENIFFTDLTTQHRLLFLSVMRLNLLTDDAAAFEDVENQYRQYCTRADTDPLSARRLRDLLKVLLEKGFIDRDEYNAGPGGGRWNTYSVMVSPSTILDAIERRDAHLEQVIAADKRKLKRTAKKNEQDQRFV